MSDMVSADSGRCPAVKVHGICFPMFLTGCLASRIACRARGPDQRSVSPLELTRRIDAVYRRVFKDTRREQNTIEVNQLLPYLRNILLSWDDVISTVVDR